MDSIRETGIYKDLMNAGIVGPTKITRFALQNAASVPSLLMTRKVMVAEKSKKKKTGVSEMPPEDI